MSMTTSMRQARVDHICQNMGGLPKTKDKNFYENFQCLMNVFLAACGGDAGYAQLLMSESPMAEMAFRGCMVWGGGGGGAFF